MSDHFYFIDISLGSGRVLRLTTEKETPLDFSLSSLMSLHQVLKEYGLVSAFVYQPKGTSDV